MAKHICEAWTPAPAPAPRGTGLRVPLPVDVLDVLLLLLLVLLLVGLAAALIAVPCRAIGLALVYPALLLLLPQLLLLLRPTSVSSTSHPPKSSSGKPGGGGSSSGEGAVTGGAGLVRSATIACACACARPPSCTFNKLGCTFNKLGAARASGVLRGGHGSPCQLRDSRIQFARAAQRARPAAPLTSLSLTTSRSCRGASFDAPLECLRL